jgi:chloride channel protein, CIC family
MELNKSETIKKIDAWLNKFHCWQLKYISKNNFLIIASIIVGIISAFAAIVLKLGVHYLQHITEIIAHYQSVKFVYIVLPLCGITITF